MTSSISRLLTRAPWIAIFALAATLTAAAAGPADSSSLRKQTDTTAPGQYAITQSNGPWMIMATTFHGEKANEQAQQLATELRTKYKLPAYTYEKTFDYSKPERGLGVTPDGKPKMMHYQHASVEKEVAVLVGDYQTVDDLTAQKVLAQIKKLEPESLRDNQGAAASAKSGGDGDKKGPMRHAIVVTNPLLPREYFAAKGIDKFVADMNKDVKFSLLDCPGRYSVKVATFTGAVIIDQSKIHDVEKGRKSLQSRLDEAAEKAHRLTLALREKQWEAYEFHDRETSIVCVGSFDSVGAPREDGKTEINPIIHRIMQTFGADQSGLATGTPLKPKTISNIGLDIQAMPVEVPRRSLSADYQRSMWSQR